MTVPPMAVPSEGASKEMSGFETSLNSTEAGTSLKFRITCVTIPNLLIVIESGYTEGAVEFEVRNVT